MLIVDDLQKGLTGTFWFNLIESDDLVTLGMPCASRIALSIIACLQHALTILNSFLRKLHCFHNMLQSLASSQASNTSDSLILGNICSFSAGIVMVLCRPVVVEFSRTRRSGGAGWSWGNYPMLRR